MGYELAQIMDTWVCCKKKPQRDWFDEEMSADSVSLLYDMSQHLEQTR